MERQMSEVKFKKGEKIVCINDEYCELEKGKIYTVEKHEGDFVHCKELNRGYFYFLFKYSADFLFEKLGYKKYENKERIKYIFEGADTIVFNKKQKTLETYIWNDGARELAKTLNKKELQAINEKCKELGWLDG